MKNNVLFRIGIIGIFIFVMLIVSIITDEVIDAQTMSSSDMCSITCETVCEADVNDAVGLDSPITDFTGVTGRAAIGVQTIPDKICEEICNLICKKKDHREEGHPKLSPGQLI